MLFAHSIVDDELVRDVLFKTHLHEFSVHGLLHWQNVEGNGLYLAQLERGDPSIVSLFALFHDSQRVNEYEDPEHGARGAFLANSFFNMGRLQISQEQLEVLIFACTYHTSQINHDDITIKCCWDADRLDLTRIGICPDPEMLNTESAKAIATQMEYDEIHHNLTFASKDKQ
jgi:uncharacterized protein